MFHRATTRPALSTTLKRTTCNNQLEKKKILAVLSRATPISNCNNEYRNKTLAKTSHSSPADEAKESANTEIEIKNTKMNSPNRSLHDEEEDDQGEVFLDDSDIIDEVAVDEEGITKNMHALLIYLLIKL